MLDKEVVIEEICSILRIALKKAKERRNKLESTEWWTERVMTELCGWALKKGKGFMVCASKMDKAPNMKELAEKNCAELQGEWLYDFTCLEYDGEWLKGIPLVAECEWGKPGDIDDDFQKLLLARADIRPMIFNGNYFREKEKTLIESDEIESNAEPYRLRRFRNYVAEYRHTRPGDTYLLAARLHESQGGKSVCHRFEFCRLEVSTAGKVCIRQVR